MKTIFSVSAVAVAFSISGLVNPAVTFAQTNDVSPGVLQSQGKLSDLGPAQVPLFTPAPDAPKKRGYPIRLMHVRPSEMAWMIDPRNHEVPIDVQASQMNKEIVFPSSPSSSRQGLLATSTQGGRMIGEISRLPLGIDRIIAIDPQNALLFFGTEDAYTQTKKLIDSLDKPRRYLEIEVQYIKMDIREMNKLGITEASPEAARGDYKIGIAPSRIQSEISTLIADKKAVMLTAPRATVRDGLTGNLRSSESVPATVKFDLKGKSHNLTELTSNEKAPQLMLTIESGITFTPNFLTDETTQLHLAPGRVLRLFDARTKAEVSHRYLDGMQTIFHARDGETLALMGADTSIMAGLNTKNYKPSNVLILVTPRILRRAGE